jgi:hypothetical protein
VVSPCGHQSDRGAVSELKGQESLCQCLQRRIQGRGDPATAVAGSWLNLLHGVARDAVTQAGMTQRYRTDAILAGAYAGGSRLLLCSAAGDLAA